MHSSEPVAEIPEETGKIPEEPEQDSGTGFRGVVDGGKTIRNKKSKGAQRVHWLSRDEFGNYYINIYRCEMDSIRGDFQKIAGKKNEWLRIDDSVEIKRYNTTMRARGLYLFMKSRHLERATQGGYSDILAALGGFTTRQWLVGVAVFGAGLIGVVVMWPIIT